MRSVLPSELTDAGFIKAHVVKDGSVNAFMTPVGTMFIHIGMLAELNDEASLASVIAHEAGHYFEHHTTEELVKYQGGETSDEAVSKFSINNELESDRHAYDWIKQSGYNIHGVKKVANLTHRIQEHQVLLTRDTSAIIETTHPKPKKRIELFNKSYQKEPDDSGKYFIIGKDKFDEFQKQVRVENLKILLEDFNMTTVSNVLLFII